MKRKSKIVIFILITIIILASGLLISKTPIKERGIVVGLGLDKVDNDILVLAQVIISGESSTPGSASAYDVLEGRGQTLSQAFEDLEKKATLKPSYAHCNILFVGKSLLENDFDKVATKLFESNRIKDNTQLIVTDQAKDSITTTVPIASTPSEYMEKRVKLSGEKGGRSIVTLKDFLQKTKDAGSRYLTYAKKVEANPPTGENTSKGDKEVFLFDLSNTAVFGLDGRVHYYGKEITEGVGLVEATGGSIIAYQDDKYINVEILKSIKTRNYTKEPLVKSKYTYYVKIVEQTLEENKEDLNLNEVKSLIERTIKEKIYYGYQTAFEDNVDIFSLAARLEKRFGEKFPFENIKWEVDVNVVIR